jgi:hypothetical protein
LVIVAALVIGHFASLSLVIGASLSLVIGAALVIGHFASLSLVIVAALVISH